MSLCVASTGQSCHLKTLADVKALAAMTATLECAAPSPSSSPTPRTTANGVVDRGINPGGPTVQGNASITKATVAMSLSKSGKMSRAPGKVTAKAPKKSKKGRKGPKARKRKKPKAASLLLGAVDQPTAAKATACVLFVAAAVALGFGVLAVGARRVEEAKSSHTILAESGYGIIV